MTDILALLQKLREGVLTPEEANVLAAFVENLVAPSPKRPRGRPKGARDAGWLRRSHLVVKFFEEHAIPELQKSPPEHYPADLPPNIVARKMVYGHVSDATAERYFRSGSLKFSRKKK